MKRAVLCAPEHLLRSYPELKSGTCIRSFKASSRKREANQMAHTSASSTFIINISDTTIPKPIASRRPDQEPEGGLRQ